MKTSKILSIIFAVVFVLTLAISMNVTSFAAESTESAVVTENAEVVAEADKKDDSTGTKALAAAIVVGIAAAVGAIAMGFAIAKCAESMARQPEAAGKINSAMMLGLVFIETLIIYALIVAILIIFVL